MVIFGRLLKMLCSAPHFTIGTLCALTHLILTTMVGNIIWQIHTIIFLQRKKQEHTKFK